MTEDQSSSRPKRRNGQGGLSLKHGKWIARINITTATGTTKRQQKQFDRREDAELWLEDHARHWGRNLVKIPRQAKGTGRSADGKEFVYFIQPLGGGPVKIGRTTNVLRRLNTIQSNSPVPLKILRVLEGGHEQESALHIKFKDDRLWGEWFSQGAVLPYVRSLEGGHGYDGVVGGGDFDGLVAGGTEQKVVGQEMPAKPNKTSTNQD